MKPLQLLSLAASSIILSLLAYLLNYEDPLVIQYEQCLAKCMQMETTTSGEKTFTRFPQLKQALDCINKADHLKSQINSIMRGPAPDIDQNQGNRLTTMNQQWKGLRAEAKNLLDQIQFAEKHGKSLAQFSESNDIIYKNILS